MYCIVSSNQSFWCSGIASITPQRRMWLNISSPAWSKVERAEFAAVVRLWVLFLLMHLPCVVSVVTNQNIIRLHQLVQTCLSLHQIRDTVYICCHFEPAGR